MSMTTKRATLLTVLLARVALGGEAAEWRPAILSGPIKAFCSDFNWGPGGPNGFARPGLWADADPARHVAWYEELGCNVIQTFAVSCNGYAWYKDGVVPEQPGLKHDFLREMVQLGHQKKMLVFGYFCIASNTRWGWEHPDLSYGVPSAYHLPFTDEYLDFLCVSIQDALRKTGMDGFMIDWVWCPTDAVRKEANGGRWLSAEKRLFEQLSGKPFPGEERLSPGERLAYERKAIDRCWARIHDAAKGVNPDCVIWLSCNQVHDPSIADSRLLREADWVMDESGTPAAMKEAAPMFGPRTRQLLCLAGWGERHKTREVLAQSAMAAYGIYGFSNPGTDSLPLPIATYLSRPIESFQGNDRGIAALARFFNGQPLDALSPAPGTGAGQPPRAAWPEDPSLPDATLNLRLTAPIRSWDEAIPLGNGLMGGLLWGDGHLARLSLDRGDLWDERPSGEKEWWKNRNWKKGGDWDGPYNGATPTKLPAGRLEITLDPSQVINGFELNLATAEGIAHFAGGGKLKTFFSAAEPVALIRISGPEPKLFDLIPSGAGKQGGDAGPSSGGAVSALGYPPAMRGHDGRAQWYVQEAAEGLKYCVCVETKRNSDETIAAVAVTSTKDAADVLGLARRQCSAALAQPYQAMIEPHAEWWRRFWERSGVHLPEPDIERYYLLARYFYGAASRRGAPPMPLQGVWTADNGGLPPWKGDYHNDLNTQMTYIGYQEAGNFDEGACFLDYLFDLLPVFRNFARDFYEAPGAAVPGVMSLAGQPLGGWGQYALSRRWAHGTRTCSICIGATPQTMSFSAPGLSVLPRDRRVRTRVAQAGHERGAQIAPILLAGDFRQWPPRMADPEQQL